MSAGLESIMKWGRLDYAKRYDGSYDVDCGDVDFNISVGIGVYRVNLRCSVGEVVADIPYCNYMNAKHNLLDLYEVARAFRQKTDRFDTYLGEKLPAYGINRMRVIR